MFHRKSPGILAVGAAGGWDARRRPFSGRRQRWRWYERTLQERVTSVSTRTCANRRMILHRTLRTHTARIGTRVCAPLIDTRLRSGTLGIDNALGPTVGR
uniref:Uncharacterized protein n=1 Tax=Cacopsylla melanoneura TaxID=428564 RepID=A0A8D9EUY9_9HEMI